MRAAHDRSKAPPAPPARDAIRAVDERGGFAPHPSPATALQQRLLAGTSEHASEVYGLSPRARVGVIAGLSALLWALIALPVALIRLLA